MSKRVNNHKSGRKRQSGSVVNHAWQGLAGASWTKAKRGAEYMHPRTVNLRLKGRK